jgi:CheY-like chemotaxis protein
MRYTVWEACDFESALSVFEEHRGEIDLAIADVSLPGKNGCELARKTRPTARLDRSLYIPHAARNVATRMWNSRGFPTPDIGSRLGRYLLSAVDAGVCGLEADGLSFDSALP